MRFLMRSDVRSRLEGRRIALVGSGPGVLDNEPGFIDGHDVVCRVNNYKLSKASGFRTDVFYSYFGNRVHKTAAELQRAGVTLCLCKCPDAHAIESDWHRRNGKMHGVDFRWIYEKRKSWWFCDTYVPSVDVFLVWFKLLGGHIPTTGFAAILELLACHPASLYLAGFDFFASRIHNVDEPWREQNSDDPIGHRPDLELGWLAANANQFPITMDAALARAIEQVKVAA